MDEHPSELFWCWVPGFLAFVWMIDDSGAAIWLSKACWKWWIRTDVRIGCDGPTSLCQGSPSPDPAITRCWVGKVVDAYNNNMLR